MLLCENNRETWRLSQFDAVKKINNFLYSRAFLPILALLAVIGHIFAVEMVIYWIYAAIMVYVSLFGRDFLLLLPVTINCYIMPSYLNNPGKHESSIFYMENGAYWFMVIGGLIFAAALFRLLFDREIGFYNLRRVKLKLLWGMLALGVAYLLSGLGSEHYADIFAKNLLFSLLQFVSVFFLYFILCFSVKWEECDKRYWFYTILLMGAVISIEVLNIYCANGAVVDGVIKESRIYVGWGISNNIGMHTAFAVPAAFYLIYKGEHPVLYNVAAILLCVFTLLSISRAAILGVAGIYVVCAVFVIFKGKTKCARWSTLVCVALCFGAAAVVLIYMDVFSYAFVRGLDSSGRTGIYRLGLELFGKDPVLGGGFFSLNDYLQIGGKVEAFTAGFPDRWHNTVIQILASCGAVGMLAYLFHRYQTVKLFVTKINDEKIFIGASLLLLLGLSLIDCHFFNVGPVLIYSASLAFAERKEELPAITEELG